MKPLPLRSIKRGEFIRRKPNSLTVYIKGDYIRDENWATGKPYNQYSLIDSDDINREIFLKGSTIVYAGFEY